MKRQKTQDMYTIRSRHIDSLLILEAIHTDTDTVFHIYETEVASERDVSNTLEAYKRFMAMNNNYLRMITRYLASFFEVDYRGKTMNEVAKLIDLKIADLKERGELGEDEEY